MLLFLSLRIRILLEKYHDLLLLSLFDFIQYKFKLLKLNLNINCN